MRIKSVLLTIMLLCFMNGFCMSVSAQEASKPLRAGIIGCDTSHVIAFTKILNDPQAKGSAAKVKVVAAFPGGSPDLPLSHDRVDKFTKQLRDQGIEIVDSIPALLEKVDVVLLESVDGRPHLEQVRPVLAARKPVFIDKPVAGSLADAIEIFELARENGTPCFSSSALRYGKEIDAIAGNKELGEVVGTAVYGPCNVLQHHPDLYFYGIHGVEMLYTIMGTGCVSVARVQTDETEHVVGTWQDGRVGTYRGLKKGKNEFGAMVFGTKSHLAIKNSGYERLLEEVCKFFLTGKPPVNSETTLEIYTFLDAADESKRQGGKPVSLKEIRAKAQVEVDNRRNTGLADNR